MANPGFGFRLDDMYSGARPKVWLLAMFGVVVAIGFGWGLPGSDSWAADSISPRSCGLGAIVETYWPGHFHTYPPLHMAVLTFLSLPWMGLAAWNIRATGFQTEALSHELVQPLYMTGIEVAARIVTACMAFGILLHTMRLWERLGGPRVGVAAGVTVATNATLVYYAHTGNLEVPYLFWVTRAVVEMDRVMCGEARESQCLLCALAAVLTKDQAAAALLLPLPLSLGYVPWVARHAAPARRPVLQGVGVAAGLYVIASGALSNPKGFLARVAFLLGPASQTWSQYPRGLHGTLALAADAFAAIPRSTSWAVAAAAALGVVIAAVSRQEKARARLLMPLVGALSFTLLFSLGARRTEDRFLLPQCVLVLPYAALALDRAWTRWPQARLALALGSVLGLAPALCGIASIDATLVADARYSAERFLASLPAGTRVEVYGGPHFLPRVSSQLVATRPGVEPIADRQEIAGIQDLVDPGLDPVPRHPDAIVLGTEFSDEAAAFPLGSSSPYGLMSYRDATSRAFFRALFDGSLGYTRVLRARCTLSWPLECRQVHGSTGREVWIYAPSRGPSMASPHR